MFWEENDPIVEPPLRKYPYKSTTKNHHVSNQFKSLSPNLLINLSSCYLYIAVWGRKGDALSQSINETELSCVVNAFLVVILVFLNILTN